MSQHNQKCIPNHSLLCLQWRDYVRQTVKRLNDREVLKYANVTFNEETFLVLKITDSSSSGDEHVSGSEERNETTKTHSGHC